MNQTKTLYRDPEQGKIAGVCAGVAQYFGLETWLVRILFVTGFFLLAGPFVLVAYVAAWFILDKKNEIGASKAQSFNSYQQSMGKGWRNTTCNMDGIESSKIEVKTKVWQAGEPPRQALLDITERFKSAEARLRKMETYVTSREFQLNREISRL